MIRRSEFLVRLLLIIGFVYLAVMSMIIHITPSNVTRANVVCMVSNGASLLDSNYGPDIDSRCEACRVAPPLCICLCVNVSSSSSSSSPLHTYEC